LVVPTPRGQVNPAVMAAVKMLGLKEVYTIGGAQAVAALAYGTESIRPVEKIVGPGNIYVATAKRLVFGVVDIDMVAGPSEILVLADETAPPAFVAADLLSQAEHDPMASAVLVSTSEALAQAVRKELQRQLRALPKAPVAQEALRRWGAIILVRDIQEALEVVNRIAPEHLELMCRHPRAVLKGVRNAGAVFLGPWSPEPLGDYVAGPNHTLPTGGTARFFSPLGVYDFLKHSSLLQFSRKAFEALAPWAEALEEPLKLIAANAGAEGSVILEEIKKHEDDFGYDAEVGEFGRMFEKGIIDPCKVTRAALENAASVAAMVLTTESMVTEIPEKEKERAPSPPMEY